MGGWRYALLVGLRVICCGCGWFDLDAWCFVYCCLRAGRAGGSIVVCLFVHLVGLLRLRVLVVGLGIVVGFVSWCLGR